MQGNAVFPPRGPASPASDLYAGSSEKSAEGIIPPKFTVISLRNKHLFLKQDTCFFSARGDFTPCGNVTMPGNVFDCQDWEPAPSKWLESTGKLLCISPCSRQPRATKHCLVPDIDGAKVRKPCASTTVPVCVLGHLSRV